MAMTPILEVHLGGWLDDVRLGRLRKLLNLEPHGRLTDTQDAHFGHRSVRDVPDEWVWLDLFRRDGDRWLVTLTHAGPRPADEVVARGLAEVLGAADAVGLAVTRIWPDGVRPAALAQRLDLPARRAWSVRLAGGERTAGRLAVATLDQLQRALDLRRERGGVSGTESGWRYVRWDPPGNSALLQLLDDPATGTELVLLFDGQPPAGDVVAGCRLQIAVAAAEAGMTLADGGTDEAVGDWSDVARRAAMAATLPELLAVIGCSAATAYELTRGRLLAVTRRPEWRAASPGLRQQVDDVLLDLPVDTG